MRATARRWWGLAGAATSLVAVTLVVITLTTDGDDVPPPPVGPDRTDPVAPTDDEPLPPPGRPTPPPEPPPAPEPSPPPIPAPTRDPEPPREPTPPQGWEGPLPASLVGTEWERIPTDAPVVTLTFDAGANADGVPSILATLESTDTAGTFFLTGRFVAAFPEATLNIAERFPIGNHTVDHPDLTTLSDAEVVAQVRGAEASITATTGRSPVPLFRFPYGARDARTIGLINDAGYGGFRWTVDTLGWQGTSGGRSADEVVQRVLGAATPGQIVLLHVGSHPTDGSTLDADALPLIIDGLTAQGYRFVTLPEALASVAKPD